ncbi:MAG: Rieske (2Fe-2S) protein [Myxococcota bacterium]
MSQWIEVGAASSLAPGGVVTVKHGAQRIAVFRTADGEVRATDDRCPHEGYPLSQGTVAGCVLTCQYHNYKFDLRDGACLMGDEALQVVPVRIEGDRIYVDPSGPDPAAERPRRWASLDAALDDDRTAQASRDTVRLLALGVPLAGVAAHVAAWEGERAAYGATHALPLSAEALRLAPHLPGLDAAAALLPALELAGRGSCRRPPHPRDAADPGPPAAFAERLRAAVEPEDVPQAVALVRGAVRAGFAPEVLQEALLRVASDHLLDYGHGVIYVTKAFDLLGADGVDPDDVEGVLAGLVRELATATREDLVPTWAPWRRRVAALGPLPAGGRGAVPDREAAVAALVGATPREAVEHVLGWLEAGVAVAALWDVVSLAAAERVLRFDVAHDLDPDLADAWLDVTHLLTFAAACRVAWARCPHPELVRLLLQGARLVARMRPLDGPRPPLDPADGDLVAAIRAGDAAQAVRIAAGCDPEAVRWPLGALALDPPGAGLPIFVAHAVKLSLAGCDEALATGDPRPLAAAVRFLASPKRERRTPQRVREAVRLVAEGRPPRTLAV